MEVSTRTVQTKTPDDPFAHVGQGERGEETGTLHVERVTTRVMMDRRTAWQDLCDRAIERNVFFEPSFALPLFQHVASPRPDFVLVWEENSPTAFGRLIGLLPIMKSERWRPGLACGFIHPQTRLGTPLLDRDRAAEGLEALLAWLRDHMQAAALRLNDLDADGPFYDLLTTHCATTDRSLRRFNEHPRAVLKRETTHMGMGMIMPFAHGKRRKEMSRQRRRLSERGPRNYSSAATPDEIARATERFLALEHKGWKGQRGTALLTRPSLVTFTRSMTRLMGREGKCRIDSIEIDGAAVAMGIILTVGDRGHFWKTTFNEVYRPLSPGVQFALELTDRQLADQSVSLTDSCAVPDHPMIDRLWRDRMGVTDILVELDPARPGRFRRASRFETIARGLRHRLKTAYLQLRRIFKNR